MDSVNERNELLIELNGSRWPGLGCAELVTASAKAYLNNIHMFDDVDTWANEQQIKFAKRVWNQLSPHNRTLMLKGPTDAFITLAADRRMVPILTAALDAFLGNTRSGGGNALAYQEIRQKYEAAVIKQNAQTAFTEQLTPGEERLIAKFEAHDRDPVEEHKPNEQAVTYCFLIGRMAHHLCGDVNNADGIADILLDVFDFIGMHGIKGQTNLIKVLTKYDNIVGPRSSLELKPVMTSFFVDVVKKGTTANANNKFVENFQLTLPRIMRIVAVVTHKNTVWGLMNHIEDDFIVNIKRLYELETSLEQADKSSLAIVWYLCIGRNNVMQVMVDHWEESGLNELSKILGKARREKFDPPPHVFPLAKNINTKFNK